MENVYRSNFLEGKAARKPILNELMNFCLPAKEKKKMNQISHLSLEKIW